KMTLVNGNSPCEGRVEVRHEGQWGTVCDDEWDMNDAAVVCRQMFCGDAVAAPPLGHFGEGKGMIWLAAVPCSGSESTLKDCGHRGWGQHYCTHAEDAGVICSGTFTVRLASGPHLCSGRLEFLADSWYTVCDPDFDLQDAKVVCRQLGCGTPVQVQGAAVFECSGPIWADVFECQGEETHLSQCAISSWIRAPCSHEHVSGIIYADVSTGSSLSSLDGMVRLSGESGCEGQLEVHYQHTWSRVLLDSWSIRETSVVCRQLGCGSAVRIYSSSMSGTGDTDVCLTGYQCSGTESHLVNCSAPHTLSCSSNGFNWLFNGNSLLQKHYIFFPVYLLPEHRSLRLVGDEGGCAGRLEVFHQGSWGTVCGDSWDLNDAQVVCRQLQCGTALRSTSFGPGVGVIWLDEVDCVGNELSLWDCPSAQWGQHDCGHKKDVGIVCSEFKDLRLAEGCSGQLEVYYNDTWGNVCFNQMDTNTVSLICQQLNCGKSGTVSNTESRLKGAPNWLDYFKCRPHDSALWQCPSSPWGQNKCDDEDEVALITCERKSDPVQPTAPPCPPDVRLVNGNSPCEGRVEVLHQGQWGTVCGYDWDITDASVVCEQIFCGYAVAAPPFGHFGAGTGKIWLSWVDCGGSESTLKTCEHEGWGEHYCVHYEDAGVICSGRGLFCLIEFHHLFLIQLISPAFLLTVKLITNNILYTEWTSCVQVSLFQGLRPYKHWMHFVREFSYCHITLRWKIIGRTEIKLISSFLPLYEFLLPGSGDIQAWSWTHGNSYLLYFTVSLGVFSFPPLAKGLQFNYYLFCYPSVYCLYMFVVVTLFCSDIIEKDKCYL
uniref:SRCR domain-containing protein n=1 Tax=Scleropages formosus TaxID=113540 RepID=A0A8C9W4I2_SCLFO